MSAIVALALEFAKVAPQMIDAGISITGLWVKSRAALDAVSAPGTPDWDAADQAVSDLKARALDPATDDR